MPMAKRLKWYLDSHHVEYEIISHAHSSTSLESAHAAHIPGGRVAKCVLLEDERGYVMAIVPASCRVQLDEIDAQTGRHLELASEEEIEQIFEGCEKGAIPPFGALYNIPTAIDDSLLRQPDIYFEAGNHLDLVHVSGKVFRELFGASRHGRFSRPH